jgi:hypothetical protein
MFFWIGLVVVLVAFIAAVAYGVRGIDGRGHKPGTQRMK